MSFWLIEDQTEGYRLMWKVVNTLCRDTTPYQELEVVQTHTCGKALILDGIVQTTAWDEFIYHEMLAHVTMVAHPKPEKVLVIGGGDGGIVKEILKHDQVKSVDLVEIDEKVVSRCREFLPEISSGLEDCRANVIIEDGIRYVKTCKKCYDVIIVDSPDPVGPAVGLYGSEFYNDLQNMVDKGGMMVVQTESPFFNQDIIRNSFAVMKSIFPITRLYLACVPTYPSGMWSYCIGSREQDPLDFTEARADSLDTRYYNAQVHRGAFCLPNFVKKIIEY